MANGIPIACDVPVLPRAANRGRPRGRPRAEQRPHRLERGLVVSDQIELGAIAGGKQDSRTRARCHDAGQRARHLVRAVRKTLAHVEWRGAVVHTDDLDPHLCMTRRHRNRSVPGCVSFRATYTRRTAPKPAMLASAARRPAQWRTTRTHTAQPSTTHVKTHQTSYP